MSHSLPLRLQPALPSPTPCYSLFKMPLRANHYRQVRSEVFTAVTMKNGVFWDVTPWDSCKNRHFGGTLFLRSVRRLLVAASVVPWSPILVTLMKQALSSSETLVLAPFFKSSYYSCYMAWHTDHVVKCVTIRNKSYNTLTVSNNRLSNLAANVLCSP
jgi:hypothetical protein